MKKILSAIGSLAFAFLALHTDQTQHITQRLADGTLAPVVRDIHTEHFHLPTTPDRFDQATYDANMRDLRYLSVQSRCESGDKTACGSRKK